jgi:hypothetical protein
METPARARAHAEKLQPTRASARVTRTFNSKPSDGYRLQLPNADHTTNRLTLEHRPMLRCVPGSAVMSQLERIVRWAGVHACIRCGCALHATLVVVCVGSYTMLIANTPTRIKAPRKTRIGCCNQTTKPVPSWVHEHDVVCTLQVGAGCFGQRREHQHIHFVAACKLRQRLHLLLTASLYKRRRDTRVPQRFGSDVKHIIPHREDDHFRTGPWCQHVTQPLDQSRRLRSVPEQSGGVTSSRV